MSTQVPERDVSGAGAGGTEGFSGANFGGFYGDPAPAVFALPFLGWLALADVVADAAPAIAEVMTATAYLAQSALEEHLPDLIDSLGELLIASGFSSGGVDSVRSALLADRLAFSPTAVTNELAARYADLGEEAGRLTGPEDLQLIEAAITAFLDSDRVGPDARTIYDDMADRAAQKVQPHWWAVCSLDQPSVLGTGKLPIYCAQRGHWFGNSLLALEWTYGGTLATGFKGKVADEGQVGAVADGGYRSSIDHTRANYYWNSLGVGSSGLAFALSLSEGRGRWANKVAEAIDGRREQIGEIVGEKVRGAQANIDTLLSAAMVPTSLFHPVAGLMVAAARAVIQGICAALVKNLSDKSLTTWAIWHTAVMGQRKVPISVFTLSRPGADTPGLQYLKPGQDPSGELTASDDYSHYPVFKRQARYMIGASEPPYGEFNDALFDLTARSPHPRQPPQPLAWREPLQTNSGFRILVPHWAPGTKASYVSALRVDVKLEERPAHFEM